MAKKVETLETLMAEIPKDHKKTLNKIVRLATRSGRQEVLDLVLDLGKTPAKDIHYYGFHHERDLDGG